MVGQAFQPDTESPHSIKLGKFRQPGKADLHLRCKAAPRRLRADYKAAKVSACVTREMPASLLDPRQVMAGEPAALAGRSGWEVALQGWVPELAREGERFFQK